MGNSLFLVTHWASCLNNQSFIYFLPGSNGLLRWWQNFKKGPRHGGHSDMQSLLELPYHSFMVLVHTHYCNATEEKRCFFFHWWIYANHVGLKTPQRNKFTSKYPLYHWMQVQIGYFSFKTNPSGWAPIFYNCQVSLIQFEILGQRAMSSACLSFW